VRELQEARQAQVVAARALFSPWTTLFLVGFSKRAARFFVNRISICIKGADMKLQIISRRAKIELKIMPKSTNAFLTLMPAKTAMRSARLHHRFACRSCGFCARPAQ